MGGIIGGMGMGGGTFLIPLLTAVCGIEQTTAQAVNLIAFIPMSIISVIIHAKNGLIKPKYLLSISLPAVILSIPASIIALQINSDLLKNAFGIFLIILGIKQFFQILFKQKTRY
ncbi:MAG: sulfite exporter TauE/SafE family protein [Clostridia bacterium]|nr:sulfite exporter TauE/SafE family protein [Clostridia bacterium]